MAHTNKVLRSINLDGKMVCVDIFQRPNGSFGFDEFRRDIEDGRGWFSIGHQSFTSEDKALATAIETVGWLVPDVSS